MVDYFHSKDHRIYQWMGEFSNGHSNAHHKQHYEDVINGGDNYSSYRRAEIDLDTKQMISRNLVQGACEFARINPSLQGSKHRYSYLLQRDESQEFLGPWFPNVMNLKTAVRPAQYIA